MQRLHNLPPQPRFGGVPPSAEEGSTPKDADGSGKGSTDGEVTPLTPVDGELVETDGNIVRMTVPLDRSKSLEGTTYKVKWPNTEHAIYVTINDIVLSGRRRPFEMFINSKNMEHYAWTVALTRLISDVFRRGGDISFVVEELKAVFAPQGGEWMGGKCIPPYSR